MITTSKREIVHDYVETYFIQRKEPQNVICKWYNIKSTDLNKTGVTALIGVKAVLHPAVKINSSCVWQI